MSCLTVYLWCQGCQIGRALQEIPLNFQGCYATCPSSIQWLWGESIGATTDTTIISYVAWYNEINGVRDQGICLVAWPLIKSSWVTQLWDLPSWHHDLQGEDVSTLPTQVMARVLVGEIRDTVPSFPCNSIHLYNPITHMWVIWSSN